MADFEIVDTNEGPRVRVNVTETDPEKRQEEISRKLANSEYEYLDVKPDKTTAQKIVRGAALPTALGAIGGLAGPIGMIGGTMAGEAINQMFDPLDSGATGGAISVGLAGGLAAASPLLRAVGTHLPGAEAGMQANLQRVIGPNGQRVIDMIAPPPGTATQLFKQLEQQTGGRQVLVGTTKLVERIKDLKGELSASSFENDASKTVLATLERMLGSDPDRVIGTVGTRYVPFDRFRATMVDLGKELSALEATGGAAYGRAKALYQAMWADVDNTVTKSANTMLRDAVKAFKQELGADALRDYFLKSSTMRNGVFNVDVNSVMTKIVHNTELLEKYIGKDGVEEVMGFLTRYGQTPNVVRGTFPTTPAQRLLSTAVGADALSSALSTKPGRQAVSMMAGQGQTIDQISNLLAQSMRQPVMPSLFPTGPGAPPAQQ